MHSADFKKNIKSILVVRRNNIGDMICALPAIKTLRKEFPLARIAVMAEKINSIIIRDVPYIDRVLVYEKGTGLFENRYLNFWRLLRRSKLKFDLVIVLKAGYSSTSALMTLISGARYRMGCLPEKWHLIQFCYNFPVKVQEYWHPKHIKEIFIEILKPLGIENPVMDISFEIPRASKERVLDFFNLYNIQAVGNVIVFNISNNRSDTIWHPDRYKKIAGLISAEYDAAFIITSVPADRERAVMLSKEIDNAFYFDEVAVIMDFAALLAESDLLICGEGGSMHIGAAVNVPTVSLWGGTASVANWMHRDLKQYMIKKGPHINSITPEDVLEVIRDNELLKLK